jgi:gem associated protein 8
MYSRYRQNYHQEIAWIQSYQNAYRKAVASCFSFPWSFSPAFLPQSLDGHYMACKGSRYTYSHFKKPGHPPYDSSRTQATKREDQALSKEEEEMEMESDEIECDLSNMEITNQLCQYIAETQRHKEEQLQQKQVDEEHLEDYINADHDLNLTPTAQWSPQPQVRSPVSCTRPPGREEVFVKGECRQNPGHGGHSAAEL